MITPSNNTEYKRAYQLYEMVGGEMKTYDRNADSYLRRGTDPSHGTVMQLSLNYANKFGDHNVGG